MSTALRIPAPAAARETSRRALTRVVSVASLACVRAGTLHHICQALAKALFNPEFQDVRIVYYTSQDPRDVTNSIYLLGAFLCLHLGATPEEAWRPFQQGHVQLPNVLAVQGRYLGEKLIRSAGEGLLGRPRAG